MKPWTLMTNTGGEMMNIYVSYRDEIIDIHEH